MKKIISIFIVCIMLMSVCGISTFAAYEAPTEFSCIFDYKDRVYTTDFYGWASKFYGLDNLCSIDDVFYGYIDSFCIYHDKVYFMEYVGSGGGPTNIFSCNIDGRGLTLLANNADSLSKVTIVDGVLYYAAYGEKGDWRYKGGIFSINLNDLSWKKICSDNANIDYCDGDYIYYDVYSNGYPKTYAIRTNGTGKIEVNPYCDEFRYLSNYGSYSSSFLKGNKLYYTSGNQVYVRNKNGGNAIWLGTIPSSEEQHGVVSVTDNHVYCVNIHEAYSGYHYAMVYKFNR